MLGTDPSSCELALAKNHAFQTAKDLHPDFKIERPKAYTQ